MPEADKHHDTVNDLQQRGLAPRDLVRMVETCGHLQVFGRLCDRCRDILLAVSRQESTKSREVELERYNDKSAY